jgi:hypothetical protein
VAYGENSGEGNTTVSVGNTPPVITETASVATVDEGSTATFAITAIDGTVPQDDGISKVEWFTKKNSDSWVSVRDGSISAGSGTPVSDSYTFAPDIDAQLHDGTNTWQVKVVVTDGLQPSGVPSEKVWDITVVDVNTKPLLGTTTVAITPTSPITIDDLRATVTPGGTDADAEDDYSVLTYWVTWTKKSDGAVMKPSTKIDATNDVYLDHSLTEKNETYVATVIVKDGADLASDASSSSEITVINQAPVAVDDTVTTALTESSQVAEILTTELVTNDSDIDGLVGSEFDLVEGTITTDAGALVSIVTLAGRGASSEKRITYSANGKFESLGETQTTQDTFTYQIKDTDGATASATATVTIAGENDLPEVADVRMEAQDGSGNKIPTTDPTLIEKINATFTANDVDKNDGEFDADITWTISRKGETDVTVNDSQTDGDLVTPAAFDFDLPKSAAVNGSFEKGDKVKIEVTVTDEHGGVSALLTKTFTIGNPSWFPALDLVDLVDSGIVDETTYLVELKTDSQRVTVGTLVTAGNSEIKPIDYLNANWGHEIKGFISGESLEVVSIRKFNAIAGRYENVAVSSSPLDNIETYSDATITTTDTESTPGIYEPAENNGTYTMNFSLSSAAGYKYTFSRNGAIVENKLVLELADNDGSVSTDFDVEFSRFLDKGDYQLKVTALNPVEATSPAELVWEFSVSADSDPSTTPGGSVDWSKMIPGGGITASKDAAAVGVSTTGRLEVHFSWPNMQSARSYGIAVVDIEGRSVIRKMVGLETHADFTLPVGTYQWWVIAKNEAGYSTWSDTAWFRINSEDTGENTPDPTPSTVIGATIDLASGELTLSVDQPLKDGQMIEVYFKKTNDSFIYYKKGSDLVITGITQNDGSPLDGVPGNYEVYARVIGGGFASDYALVPLVATAP